MAYKRTYGKKRRFNRARKRYGRRKYSRMSNNSIWKRFTFQGTTYDAGTNSVADVPQATIYRLNSMYDPDVSGIGSQPAGFSQLMGVDYGSGLYNQYLVSSSKASVRFTNKSDQPIRVGLAHRRSSSIPGLTINYLVQSNGTKTCILQPKGQPGSTKTLSLRWDAKRWFNKTTVLNELDLRAGPTTNPKSEAFLHVFADNMNSGFVELFDTEVKIDFMANLSIPVTPDV